ncbi:hypothetical protein FB451DRAFT_1403979 [Mycena latifolia]|nr:hypothetical protein FB451DRAFT_1403979 [Mycena latifolia]
MSDDGEDLTPIDAPYLREICLRGNILLSRTGHYLLLARMEFTPTAKKKSAVLEELALALRCWDQDTMARDISACFHLLPSLPSLVIDVGAGRLRAFLQCLASTEFLPTLTSLTLSGCRAKDVDVSRLIGMLESRAPILSFFHFALKDDPSGWVPL